MSRRAIVIGVAAASVLVAATLIWWRVEAAGDSPTHLSGYSRTSDPRSIVVRVETDRHHVITRTEVTEDEATVKVTVWHRSTDDGPTVGVGRTIDLAVRLKEPLGRRTVVDRHGRAIPEEAASD